MKNIPAYLLTATVIIISAFVGLLLNVPFFKGAIIALVAIVLISGLNSLIALLIYNLKKILENGKQSPETV